MLALVGSGEYLPPMEAVDRYLLSQLKAEAHVICLPTAAGTEGTERVNYWMELGKAHFSKLGAQVEALPVIDGFSANQAKYAECIRQANFIYLSGGKPDYLYRTLVNSLAWGAIMEVLKDGGVVAGCSAGAMIMGERIPGFPHAKKAFGLVRNTVIMPHFDEIPKAMINTFRMLVKDDQILLGIEGNTALVGENDDWQVVGSGGVVVWKQTEKRRFTDGEQVKWMKNGRKILK
jgi:cyanophycinase